VVHFVLRMPGANAANVEEFTAGAGRLEVHTQQVITTGSDADAPSTCPG
jgi:hypothetical protein